ncbi:LOW QUALITY PROTEIN: hypothetical protein YC2023_082584 [Brassica napus]
MSDDVIEENEENATTEKPSETPMEEHDNREIVDNVNEEEEDDAIESDNHGKDETYGFKTKDDESVNCEACLFYKSDIDDEVEILEEEIDVFVNVNYNEKIHHEDDFYLPLMTHPMTKKKTQSGWLKGI